MANELNNPLKDPKMKDIVIAFCDESDILCEEIMAILEELETNQTDADLWSGFQKKIERVISEAKLVSATDIVHYAELGRLIGSKASETTENQLLTVAVAVLSDNVEIIESILKSIRTEQDEKAAEINSTAFNKRLTWLATKFKEVEKPQAKKSANKIQEDFDKILKQSKK